MNTANKTYHHGNLKSELLARAAEVIDQHGIEALALRGLARDLGVSHGAPNRHFKNKASLLAALVTEGWLGIRDATLAAAEGCGTDNPHIRLNAMGRGYLKWAFDHPAQFRTLHHPDVNRFADPHLRAAITEFAQLVEDAVAATQADGRHPDVPLKLLALFTNAVPTGVAVLMLDQLIEHDTLNDPETDTEQLIAQVIDLVVPIKDYV